MKKSTRNLIIILSCAAAAIIAVTCALVFTLGKKTDETYTVRFESNGGSAVLDITDVSWGSLIDEPVPPVKEGYTFDGWFSDKECTKLWRFASDKVKSDVILYAKWTYNKTEGLVMEVNGDGYVVTGLGGASDKENLVIPQEYNGTPVIAIAEAAFKGCSTLKTVYVPSSVKTVGKNAFAQCASLTNVTLSDGVTTLGVRAFYMCQNLETVKLSSDVKIIPSQAFYKCGKLRSIGLLSVETIGTYAFYDCASLVDVEFSVGLKTIEHHAFSGCYSVKEISLPNSLVSMGVYAFSGCYGLEKLEAARGGQNRYYSEGNCIIENTSENSKTVALGCKTSVIPVDENINIIGEAAFYGMRTLENIVIPKYITRIDDSAFSGCLSITKIIIPANVAEIGDYAFTDCENMSEVYFGNEATTAGTLLVSIGKEAFSHCFNLGTIIIPNSVASIGAGAFYCGADFDDIIEIHYIGSMMDFDQMMLQLRQYGNMTESEMKTYSRQLTIICHDGNNGYAEWSGECYI